MSTVSENIKKYRVAMGLKQSELAAMLGKSHNVLSNWEAGTNRPDVDSISKLLEIFNIDANTLFDWPTDDLDSVTYDELQHIKKYRALDERGKKAVDDTLEREYSFVKQKEEPSIKITARGGGVRTITGQDALDLMETADKINARRQKEGKPAIDPEDDEF